jgi:hypothetical protein
VITEGMKNVIITQDKLGDKEYRVVSSNLKPEQFINLWKYSVGKDVVFYVDEEGYNILTVGDDGK